MVTYKYIESGRERYTAQMTVESKEAQMAKLKKTKQKIIKDGLIAVCVAIGLIALFALCVAAVVLSLGPAPVLSGAFVQFAIPVVFSIGVSFLPPGIFCTCAFAHQDLGVNLHKVNSHIADLRDRDIVHVGANYSTQVDFGDAYESDSDGYMSD